MKKMNYFDYVLYQMQKVKMKELWDNPYDEIWETLKD